VKVRFDIILPAAAAIIGAAAAWNGYDMGLIQFGKPGAGLFPLLIGMLLTLLSIPELLRAWNAPAETARDSKRRTALEVSIFAALVVYVAALPYIGFLASSTALVAFLLYLAGRKRLTVAVALSVALVFPIYAIFAWALNVQFPQPAIF
jgi:hypothetical protein